MAAHLSPWERLKAAATLGTERAPLRAEGLWPDESVAHTSENPSQTLLRAAVATYTWELAGRRAGTDEAAASPQESRSDDPSTHASEAATWRLARMIGGDHRDLIPEWFALAQANGRTVAPQWLPVALDALTPSERNEYSAVLGPVALWLAERNPGWALRAHAQAPSEERWTTGTLEERRAELKSQRELDPARGLSWLQSTWETDPPEAREAFLAIMLVGLSPHDEPFLESALDDKRKGVRLAAAECLSRLAQSAHAQRNLARLDPLITLDDKKGGLFGGLRKRKLAVELPSSIDKAAVRDGIEAKPPANRKIGDRAYWLTQMIGMTPPTHWTSRFACDAATFIESALATDYSNDFLSALGAAVVRHPDQEWIEALSVAWSNSQNDATTLANALASLINAVPQSRRGTLLEARLRDFALRRFDVAYALLHAIDLPWTAVVTRLALDGLAASVRSDRQQWSHARNALDSWACRCDIDSAQSRVAPLLDACGEGSPWRNALEQMNEIVDFRAAMKKELRSDG